MVLRSLGVGTYKLLFFLLEFLEVPNLRFVIFEGDCILFGSEHFIFCVGVVKFFAWTEEHCTAWLLRTWARLRVRMARR